MHQKLDDIWQTLHTTKGYQILAIPPLLVTSLPQQQQCYLHLASFSCQIALDMIRTHPRKPTPCFTPPPPHPHTPNLFDPPPHTHSVTYILCLSAVEWHLTWCVHTPGNRRRYTPSPPPPHTHTVLLTSCVFQLLDGIGHDAYTPQETGPLLLVNLLVVPYTDRDGILASKVSGKWINFPSYK